MVWPIKLSLGRRKWVSCFCNRLIKTLPWTSDWDFYRRRMFPDQVLLWRGGGGGGQQSLECGCQTKLYMSVKWAAILRVLPRRCISKMRIWQATLGCTGKMGLPQKSFHFHFFPSAVPSIYSQHWNIIHGFEHLQWGQWQPSSCVWALGSMQSDRLWPRLLGGRRAYS